jgi:hypothetical protein
VEKLRGKLEVKATSASPAEAGPRAELGPNLDRLTVGVDLGDQWSYFCILGLQGETLSEGQLRTSEAEVAEFLQPLPSARVVMEVGTHSPWMQEIIAVEGTRGGGGVLDVSSGTFPYLKGATPSSPQACARCSGIPIP